MRRWVFFLHIPFPSFEIFRLLIWREEILRGLLGADLIGFHTYDYVRHFLSSTRRLLGLENCFNKICYEDRYIQVDVFPMGIDYKYFSGAYDDSLLRKEIGEICASHQGTKIILSIDRLDYTKGIPERIRAFGRFLATYPEYREKVRLYLIVAPSRVEVDSYDALRREITERISEVNGRYGTVKWMPIWYFFQTFTQDELICFYKHSDVLLVTPIRDGMNLVVKEYITARTDCEGMVVISETAGAVSELGEAVIVNANNYYEVAAGIKTALEMPTEEKIDRNTIMHRRLKRYNVQFWAGEFLSALNRTVLDSKQTTPETHLDYDSTEIETAYRNAQKRILFLDYDGTLVGFTSTPDQAKPDANLRSLLSNLSSNPKNIVVIISGRDRHTLAKWLGDLNLYLMAAHGLWLRHPGQEWMMTVPLSNEWKDSVRHVMELYTDRMPGSLIEEKDFSLAFHYRQCNPDMVEAKLYEVRDALTTTIRSGLELQEGNKVLEVKDNRANKGYGASLVIQNQNFDFILGAGDDYTDENLFSSLPEDAVTIKIGLGDTNACYRMKSWNSMRTLLEKFSRLD